MKWIDYREKLGLGFNDDERIKLFLAKAYMAFSEMIQLDRELSSTQFNNYCFNAGIKTNLEYYSSYAEDSPIVFKHLQNSTDSINNFLYYYSIFLSSSKNGTAERSSGVKAINYWAEQAGLEFEFIKDNDNVFIYTKGAKELDDALVSEPLEWLKAYPKAYKTYCIALKQYSEGEYVRDTADNLRKALEEFLQEFLGNEKNLETNKTEICKYLGNQGVDAGITGLFQPLINSYKNINDRIAKHNDKVDKKLLEFLLYQTGVLIRMVLSVKQGEE